MAARSCAPFSFHCVICFEAFDADDRPPVVLPCGHTYICAPCSKRLKRCMECRTELFLTPPPSRASQQQQAARNRSNASRYAAEPLRPPPSLAEPIALPLPKNLVMMTLMEAALSEESARRGGESDNDGSNVSLDSMDVGGDENVLASIDALASPCGTYVVRTKGGLKLLKQHASFESTIDEHSEEAVEEWIDHGSFVQVVDINGPVMKLARGRGFVVANSGHMVKIGGAHDKVSRIEGMISSLQKKQLHLQNQLNDMKLLERGLRKEMENILSLETTPHPVIQPPRVRSLSDPSLRETTANSSLLRPSTFVQQSSNPPQPNDTDPSLSSHSDPPVQQLQRLASDSSIDVMALHSPNTIDFSDLQWSLGEEGINGGGGRATSAPAELSVEAQRLAHFDLDGGTIARMQTQPQQSAGPERTIPASASYEAVDFRTGLSGHRALGSSKTRADGVTVQQASRRDIRRMSEHRGIARSRQPPGNRT